MDIKAHLEQEYENWKKLGHPAVMQRFVLRNGRQYKAAPYTGKRLPKKECFSNAAHLRTGDYVEGYATRPDIGILIHHAWCVKDGVVIDPTWDRPEECQYFGVKFTQAVLYKELIRLDHYGLLDTPRGLNIKFMLQIDPKLVDDFPMLKSK